MAKVRLLPSWSCDRRPGYLLAVPVGAISDAALWAGLVAGPEEMIGQPTVVTIAADVKSSMEDAVILAFDASNHSFVPMPGDLVNAAWGWVTDPASGERAVFYSATEEDDVVPETPREASPEAAPLTAQAIYHYKRRAAKSHRSWSSKEGKADCSKLAANLETVSNTLPALVSQLAELRLRQEEMEQRLSGASSTRPTAFQQPLGNLASIGSSSNSAPAAQLLKTMPPPRSTLTRAASPSKPNASQEEAAQLAEDKGLEEESGDLARSFFQSFLHSMARRMQPVRVAEQTPQEFASRGVVPTTYVERYGGYGRNRELGSLMWQVAIILDHLQSENDNAAKDATALLAVCLEQAALDGGEMDLALLLFHQHTRGRAFAPLAEQKWVTTALVFVREMDLIQTKRQDVTGTKAEKPAVQTPGPKGEPKKRPKGRGRGNQNQREEEEQA
eukprot:s3267_g10.t1